MAGIYQIDENGNLIGLQERPYDSEARLQELLARYPDLLAGDQMQSGGPRKWILIGREMGLPSEEDGSDRWSVDHLFLDQDGIPTIVEVIGQMLDYAANAVRFWPVETLRARFELTCQAQDPEQDPSKTLAAALSIEEEVRMGSRPFGRRSRRIFARAASAWFLSPTKSLWNWLGWSSSSMLRWTVLRKNYRRDLKRAKLRTI